MNIELKTKLLTVLAPLLMGSVTARATQQYITLPGAYGPITVTESGCPLSGASNPFTAGARVGFALVTNTTCTLTFSQPIAVSSVTIDIDGNNTGDISSYSLNGTPYALIGADLVAPLSSPLSLGSVSISGTTIVGNGSGTLRFTNSPPATITSLSISMTPGGAGTFFRVGFDDVPAPAPAPAPAPSGAPALSQWGMAALAIGLVLIFFRMSRLAARRSLNG